jgi:hypothetical protein
VVELQGDHSLKADLPAVSAAVQSWLAALLAGRGAHRKLDPSPLI